jgi:UDP-N-acetylmuramoyl-L-alanyl-D-glutamate--2,6-diaminopimelate ligase
MLRDMADADADYAVMEVSSHALKQDRAKGINFHSAIFTNLTQDHLDYHITLDDYFRSKARLFEGLRGTAFAVINNDDEYGRLMRGAASGRVVTYGIDNVSDYSAANIKMDASRTRFTLSGPSGSIEINSKLIGRHNIYNILAAAAWAREENIGLEAIKTAVENFDVVPGRLEKIKSSAPFSVFVDYAHTEDALKNVLQALRQICENRIIAVFGCGGERDKTKRPKMGKVASELADYAIITSDNPRSENPDGIIEQIKEGIDTDNYRVIPQRLEAIKEALLLERPKDVVLIAGKGHEDYQMLKGKTIHFDDREAVRECLKSMNY